MAPRKPRVSIQRRPLPRPKGANPPDGLGSDYSYANDADATLMVRQPDTGGWDSTPYTPLQAKRTPTEQLDLEEETHALDGQLRVDFPGIMIDFHYDDLTDTLVVNHIVVPEGQRGQGTGTKVMERILEFAKAKGLKTALTPQADPGKKGALKKFYKRLGFKKNRDDRISESLTAAKPKMAVPKPAPGESYAWVDPEGTIYSAEGYHGDWIKTYAEWLAKKTGLDASDLTDIGRGDAARNMFLSMVKDRPWVAMFDSNLGYVWKWNEQTAQALIQYVTNHAGAYEGNGGEGEIEFEEISTGKRIQVPVKKDILGIEGAKKKELPRVRFFDPDKKGDGAPALSEPMKVEEHGTGTITQWPTPGLVSMLNVLGFEEDRLWIDPAGKVHSTDKLLHEDWLFKQKLTKKNKRDGSDMEAFVAKGWAKVTKTTDGVLYVKVNSTAAVGPALKRIESFNSSLLLVDNLIVDDGTSNFEENEVKVLEGEDAADAWKKRKDARHRVDGSSMLSLFSSLSVVAFIRKRGNKFVVVSRTGKTLGTHDTREDAEAQLRAIESNKAHGSLKAGLEPHEDWPTLDNVDEAIKSLKFYTTHLGSHHGQHDFKTYAYADDTENKDVLGYADWVIYEEQPQISMIYVRKEARRKGIGTLLAKEVEAQAKENGTTKPLYWGGTTDEGEALKVSMAADAVPGLNIQAAEDCNFCGEPVFGWTCGCPGEKANAVKVKEWMAQNAEPKVEGTKESEKQPIRHCDSCGDTGRWVTRSKQMFPPNIFCGRVDCYKDLGWWTKDPGRVEAYNKFWEAQRHRVQASKVGDLELPDPPKGMTKDNEKEQDITALVGDVPPELQVRWWPVSKKIDVLNVKGEAVPGKIVAYFMASIWVSKKTARIEMIDIAPSERRKGHGKRLATWFTDFARRMGADEVKGEAIPGSEEFWTGIGWDKGGKSRGKHKGMEKVRQDLRAKVTALAYVAAAMNAAVREDWEEALTPEDAKAARALLSYFPWDLGEKELASLDSLVAKYYRTVKGKPVAPIVYTPEAKLRMLENALAALVKVPGQLEDHKAKREGEAWDQNQEREEDEGARLQRENDLRD